MIISTILRQTDVMTTLTTTLDNVTSRLDAQDGRLTTSLDNVTSRLDARLTTRVDQCMAEVANATARFTTELDKALPCRHFAPRLGLGQVDCDIKTPNGPWFIIQVAHF